MSAGFAGDRGLILWPADTDECLSADTRAARCVEAALAAGAAYAQQHSARPENTGGFSVDAGTGVEIVLGILHKHPYLLDDTVVDRHERSRHLLAAVRSRVVGVFADAAAALTTLLKMTRRDATLASGTEPKWPPLVNLVLDEAVHDDVFAEHIITQVAQAQEHDLDYVVLSSSTWLLFRQHRETPG